MRSQERSNVLHPHASGSTAFPVLTAGISPSPCFALRNVTHAVSTLRSRRASLSRLPSPSDFPAARQARPVPGDTRPSGHVTGCRRARRPGGPDRESKPRAHRRIARCPPGRAHARAVRGALRCRCSRHAPSAPRRRRRRPSAPAAAKLSNQQLDSLTAPVALYPDALLAQVLMAATYPSEVTAAAAWSSAHTNIKGDDAVKAVASEPWDPSVQSLVAFPQVLATMALEARLDDATRQRVHRAAERRDGFRAASEAQAQQSAGNLKTSEQQKVVVEQSTIQIVPANPQVVYVPTYNPTVVYGAWAYPAYPPVYVPPPVRLLRSARRWSPGSRSARA